MSKNLKEIPPVYLKVHLTVLQILGIDILPNERIPQTLFYTYSVLLIATMVVFTTAECLDLVLNYEDIYKLTFGLCCCVTHVLGAAKMFLMLYLRKKLWGYFTTLENGIFKPNPCRGGAEEFEIVTSAINMCKRQGYVFYVLTVGVTGGQGLYAALANLPYDKHNYFDGNVTVVVNTKQMPYATWTPFDYNDSPLYEIMFAFQIFSTTLYGFYIGAADAVICGFLMLIKAQFLIVKRELETLVERAQRAGNPDRGDFGGGINRIEMLDDGTQVFVEKCANECVYHHQELIALCEHAEEDFCYLMLLQFISSLLIVCFQLFQLSTVVRGAGSYFMFLKQMNT
uniref:Odorant receptor n=1 Tax=Tribolium castaneum TaxID=7070 RepID=C0Z3R2_TRICA|nr:olfactory receptor 15 [Tribolium castaneum]